jgi:hypothetical protein
MIDRWFFPWMRLQVGSRYPLYLLVCLHSMSVFDNYKRNLSQVTPCSSLADSFTARELLLASKPMWHKHGHDSAFCRILRLLGLSRKSLSHRMRIRSPYNLLRVQWVMINCINLVDKGTIRYKSQQGRWLKIREVHLCNFTFYSLNHLSIYTRDFYQLAKVVPIGL